MNHDDTSRKEFLTPQERERMRAALVSYMEYKPARRPNVLPSPLSGLFFSPRLIAAALVLAVFGSSVGVSYAAQNTLPGDWLYAIKVNVNEPLQGAFATSNAEKASWAMSVAGERVKEATALAAKGTLTGATEAELEASFSAHAQSATDAINAEASTSPEVGVEAAASYRAQLDEYGRILAQVSSLKGVQTLALVSSVQRESDRLARIGATAETKLSTSSSNVAIAAARMQQSAHAQLDQSRGLVRSITPALAPSSLSQVVSQLDDASSTLDQGEQLLTSASSGAALGTFQRALSAAKQLGAFLETSQTIHAHTGLVIAQPEGSAKQAPQTLSAVAPRPERMRPFSAAATSSASSTEEATSASSSTTTIAETSASSSASAAASTTLIVPVPIAPGW
jgi:hypothetical protein